MCACQSVTLDGPLIVIAIVPVLVILLLLLLLPPLVFYEIVATRLSVSVIASTLAFIVLQDDSGRNKVDCFELVCSHVRISSHENRRRGFNPFPPT